MSVPRQLSESGFYHVMNRGVSHSTIFEDDEDYRTFLRLLRFCMKRAPVELHAYCLMPNHYHALVRDEQGNLGPLFRNLNASYALYFNEKYERSGPLFQGRFKSECIENDAYYLTALRYILQNPKKAGLGAMETYPWSSYGVYSKPDPDVESIFAMEIAGGKDQLLKFLAEDNADECVDVATHTTNSDDVLRAFIREELGLQAAAISSLPKPQRDAALASMKAARFTVRRIERVTGIGRGIVSRAKAV